ncbi:hypothetical protein [Shewanella maritima]|uniref:hypothetical protein n=1 Tax=Shewanella maritima TaxID=2520507 RepID=UPI0037350EF7
MNSIKRISRKVEMGIELSRKRRSRIKQQSVSVHDKFEQVEWISYHIPKTAGTSLRVAFEQIFKKKQIKLCYKDSFSKEMSKGFPVWCSSNIRMIHGHFKVHPNHNLIYPNAKKIIWLRQPAERAWSMVNHWVRMGNFPEPALKLIKEKPCLVEDIEKLFMTLLIEPRLNASFAIYDSYLKHANPSDFYFIGNSDIFSDDLKRLSSMLGNEVIEPKVNQARGGTSITELANKKFNEYFPNEFLVFERFINFNLPK